MRTRKKKPISASTNTGRLRLRVFAGPNGSGKSTVINYVRRVKINSRSIDFGYYINADDIAGQLRSNGFTFNTFRVKVTNKEFQAIAIASGLINKEFTQRQFTGSYALRSNKITLKTAKADERLAQVIADFLRKKLLQEERKFSFETVFSHQSKLDVMKEAVAAGYKVYLYFVSTESPRINKFRVKARKKLGGHDVPEDKIESRYYRSLDLLFDACQLAYQAFFFDNSVEGQDSVMFAHFKKQKDKKQWDIDDISKVPGWFRKYYSEKVGK